jgi:hypothetical protein
MSILFPVLSDTFYLFGDVPPAHLGSALYPGPAGASLLSKPPPERASISEANHTPHWTFWGTIFVTAMLFSALISIGSFSEPLTRCVIAWALLRLR